jgi:hypothetical protein
VNKAQFRSMALVATVLGIVVGVVGLSQSRKSAAAVDEGDAEELATRWHRMPGPKRFGNEPTVDQEAAFENERHRRVLALYDSSETVEEEDDDENVTLRPIDSEVSLVHTLAELPLNHLGIAVDYHDVNSGQFPGPEEMKKYRGVITWFSDNKMKAPDLYLGWVQEQVLAGRRVIVMEYLGAYQDLAGEPTDPALVATAFDAIGGKHLGNWTDDASIIAVKQKDDEVMGFEQSLPGRFDHYEQYQANVGTKVYMQLERTDMEGSASDVVWSGPGGGYVKIGMSHTETRLGQRYVVRWLLNPFRFFEDALGINNWPRADFTTLNGRRIFYMHIDGDGLDTITELDYKSRCGEIIRRDVLTKYDLPVTASVVIGLTAPPPYGLGTLIDTNVARAIFRLDNVEIGSHGYAHPMDWRAGAKSELSVPGLPDYVLSGDSEVSETIKYINEHLAPPGKTCRIMLWTGWCNPTETQLQSAYDSGVRNLNGGDPRMDSHYPSYAHMVSPVHQVGSLLQYQTSAANEYILTDDWTPPYYRFQNVVQTFENTGSPKRVVPVNIYIHYYIARNFPAFEGLLNTLAWVLKQPLAPIFTSEYVDIARDFQWVRMAQTAANKWVVRKGESLRTLRFDRPDVHVNLSDSKGVSGYAQDKDLGVTYVHLSADTEVTVVLADRAPTKPFPWTATHPIEKFKVAGTDLSFETGGVGVRSFEIASLKAGTQYQVVAHVEGELFDKAKAVVDKSGLLQFTVTGKTTKPIVVRVESAL